MSRIVKYNESLIKFMKDKFTFDDNIIPQPITEITDRAFVGTPVMPLNGTQTLYVIVQDQNHDPVDGTTVNFTITYPNGEMRQYQMKPTNTRGISTLKFPIHVENPGIIEIQVTGTLEPFQVATKTSFQIWY